jgi:benzylsuccinate CoA-transferase BbsE subunit
MSGQPLSACRVLDLTDEKGMPCARFLGDMGAEVIRIEKPGDAARSTYYQANNAGKRAVTLDIEQETGRGLLRRLAAAADVLVESCAPGYLAARGLDFAALQTVNPRLVMASITGFGRDGPYCEYRISDITATALGGQMSVSGEPPAPLVPYGRQSYYLASLNAAIGILLALRYRDASGRGQHIDVSLQESVAGALDHVLVRYFYQNEVAGRRGGLHWNGAFRVFPCRDGFVLLSLGYQWETMLEWLAAEGMAADLSESCWQDREYRREHLEHVMAVLERWTQTHDVDDLVMQGQAMRFPWARVDSVEGLLNNPQLDERGFWSEVEMVDGRKLRFPGPAARLGRSPWHTGGKVPAPGQNNQEVYRELGLSGRDRVGLEEDGVI